MSDEIKADYQQLEQIASRFTQQAQVILEMSQKVRASMGKLEDGGWIGRAADAFFNEMNSLIFPACERLHTVLNDASQATKDIAQNLNQAEEEAAAPFRNTSQ